MPQILDLSKLSNYYCKCERYILNYILLKFRSYKRPKLVLSCVTEFETILIITFKYLKLHHACVLKNKNYHTATLDYFNI